MTDAAIQVLHVSKRFRRGVRHDSLRDMLAARVLRRHQSGDSAFWALRDISFQVRPGECLGIIGHNGAGKSTMLKLLAGIMRPNHGTLGVRGRLSALIELGAGFHPDLTGRENIELNACILGMTRRELRRKFDEIVAFADIGDFLEMPVKRYSSGMVARLGFAVAAHIDARVLLVDEVLSVGDSAFRAKCMAKMESFLKQGVSLVFVSHDLESVGRICDNVLLLENGRESFYGPTADAITRYRESPQTLLTPGPDGRPAVEVSGLRLCDEDGRVVTIFSPGHPVSLRFEALFNIDMPCPSYGLYLFRRDDRLTLYETSSTRLHVMSPPARPGSRHSVRYDFNLNVPPSRYTIGYHVRDRDALVYAVEDANAIEIVVEGPAIHSGPAYLEPEMRVMTIEPAMAAMVRNAEP